MMKLFHTPASHFVRENAWLPSANLASATGSRSSRRNGRIRGATETTPSGRNSWRPTPIARIPALVTEDGERLNNSSLICRYLNDELGGFRLCPQSGRERWRILSVVSVATSGVMETRVPFAARSYCVSVTPRKTSRSSPPSFVRKMMERQDRCYLWLDELWEDFHADVDLGQIAVGCACGLSDCRFPG